MNPTLRAAAIAAAAFFALTSCKKGLPSQTSPPTQTAGAVATEITNTYRVRGIVESLPEAGKPASELMIRHEAINDFVDGRGDVVGMNAMTMPFPAIAPSVALDGLAVGDKIAFEFSNTWSGPESARRPGWTIISVEKLPPETELTFAKKSTPPSKPSEPR